jgi:hypothetical protein
MECNSLRVHRSGKWYNWNSTPSATQPSGELTIVTVRARVQLLASQKFALSVINELERIWKETVMIEVVFWNLLGGSRKATKSAVGRSCVPAAPVTCSLAFVFSCTKYKHTRVDGLWTVAKIRLKNVRLRRGRVEFCLTPRFRP